MSLESLPELGVREAVTPQTPSAVLISEDGQVCFTLTLLAWETALLPCTRYDEWLVVRLALRTPEAFHEAEGAFLLRFEVEEILHAARTAAISACRFESDFLEPVLAFRLRKAEDSSFAQAHITLTPPDAPASEPVAASLTLSEASLSAFAVQVAEQLEGFPSGL
jgi:hypothetical protein